MYYVLCRWWIRGEASKTVAAIQTFLTILKGRRPHRFRNRELNSQTDNKAVSLINSQKVSKSFCMLLKFCIPSRRCAPSISIQTDWTTELHTGVLNRSVHRELVRGDNTEQELKHGGGLFNLSDRIWLAVRDALSPGSAFRFLLIETLLDQFRGGRAAAAAAICSSGEAAAINPPS